MGPDDEIAVLEKKLRELRRETEKEEIARLQKRLAQLHKLVSWNEWVRPSDENHNKGEPFYIADKSELDIYSMPNLVRLILDALDVSVFLKHAAPDSSGRGRRFIYINQTARKRKNWSAGEVPGIPDSEAFYDGEKNPLFKTMFNQETDTLKGRVSRYTQLEWQPGEAFWRRSRTLEIPVLEQNNSEPVGFCAIAEEIEFQMFPFIHSWLREVFHHEYGNMCADVYGRVEDAMDFLVDLERTETASKSGNRLAEIDSVVKKLSDAQKFLIHYGLASEELFKSFSPLNYKERKTIAKMLASLCDICLNAAPYKVLLPEKLDAELLDTEIKRSAAVLGVVIALIMNAWKHSREAFPLEPICLDVSRNEEKILWTVRNRAESLKGQLILRTFEDRKESNAKASNLTGAIIGEILSRAFPGWRTMLGPNTIFDPETGRGPLELLSNEQGSHEASVTLYSDIEEMKTNGK